MYARLNLSHESVYEAVARWAGHAPTRLLRVLLWSGAMGAVGVMAIDPVQWYIGLGLVALSGLGGWGLLEHRLVQRPSATIHLLESIVAAITVMAALTAILVALFVFMGPAPHF
jgi:hypothetical protein